MVELQDVLNIEGETDSEEEYYTSMQKLINSGSWSLPGRNGRAMMDAIDAGKCLLGTYPIRDYWGNRIPARDQIKTGTKGSYEFVVEHSGVEWADKMRDLT